MISKPKEGLAHALLRYSSDTGGSGNTTSASTSTTITHVHAAQNYNPENISSANAHFLTITEDLGGRHGGR
jgi:hypothetical protein